MEQAWSEIPVYINCRDRVSDLKELVWWLIRAGMSSITLLDNASSYPPLLAYYQEIERAHFDFAAPSWPRRVKIERLQQNLGHLALFQMGLAPSTPFILSDPDLVPLGPPSGIEYLWQVAQRHPNAHKVGFGLELEGATMPEPVRAHEASMWSPALEIEPGLYLAPIDTTLALWLPQRAAQGQHACIRTGRPHVMRHSSYFTDYQHPELFSEEERYYLAHANVSSGWKGDLERYKA